MDRYVGKMLDNRYEILEPIGLGGMAVVYKARCHRLNRFVAIKILRDEMAQEEDLRRRFHDESQAVAMLSHPNIVAVYDVSKSVELDYIVMELIDGITLKQYMQKKGDKLSWREALHFISQIVKALSHAHSRGIIHRDIKPHNMMILRDGTLKVSDFGIARLTNSTQATLTQEALGSVHYISPEQAKGSYIDARSDLYSAGVVLYEMITGRLPFEGATPVSVAIQHINSIPLTPRDIDPEIPDALESITMKAMAPEVAQRYISADAMLADLEEFRKNPNIVFTILPEDTKGTQADEPTQILGANTARMANKKKDEQQKEEPEKEEIPVVVPVKPAKTPKKRRQEEEEYEDDDDEYEYYDEPNGFVRALPGIFAVLAIFLFIGGIAYFLWNSFFQDLLTNVDEVEAPSIVGYTIDEAEALWSVVQYEFVIEEDGIEFSTAFPAGQITEQSPKAGSDVLPGTTITVTISAGPDIDVIPDVYNTDYRVATSTLEYMGLTVEIIESYNDDIASGYIISQVPSAESTFNEGDVVTLEVSLGAKVESVKIISFVNTKLEWAEAQVEALNLTYGGVVGEEYSDTIPEGSVTYQSVPVDSEVPEGTTITFKVSLGPENPVEEEEPEDTETDVDTGTEEVPDVGGETVEPEPTVTPEPTPTPSTTVTSHQMRVEVPAEYSGESSVSIQVQVGSTVAWDFTGDPSMGPFYPTVFGSGEQTITTYINGKAVASYSYDFGG